MYSTERMRDSSLMIHGLVKLNQVFHFFFFRRPDITLPSKLSFTEEEKIQHREKKYKTDQKELSPRNRGRKQH